MGIEYGSLSDSCGSMDCRCLARSRSGQFPVGLAISRHTFGYKKTRKAEQPGWIQIGLPEFQRQVSGKLAWHVGMQTVTRHDTLF